MKPRDITIPKHLRGGIKHRKARFPGINRVEFFGADIETYVGGKDAEAITLQISNSDDPEKTSLYWVDNNTILDTFLNHVKQRILPKRVNICFFHYLAYDLTALLKMYHSDFTNQKFTIHHKYNNEKIGINVLAGKLYYAKITWPDGTYIHIIDSFRFFTSSLKNVAKTLGCKNAKMAPPFGLGNIRFTPKDRKFVEYAKYDAAVEYEIGRAIIKMHEDYDVPVSISAPQFASRVFQRYFIKENQRIPLPNQAILRASLYSYHGGKNGFYVKPAMYENVTELDISSAYPHAMANLPQFIKGRYEYVLKQEMGYCGVYNIRGLLKNCKYSPFLSHDGKPIWGETKVEDLWVTSYELEEAQRTGEFELEGCRGWIWIPDFMESDNALKKYALEFYEKKQSSGKGDPNYLIYKLLLNSLYGKFLQNIEEDTEIMAEAVMDEFGHFSKIKKTYKAGGLFNPFIGTLITGFVRAHLHKLEHKYESIHSSTDSIKTLQNINIEDLPKGLGGLNAEITGDCIVLRNKLYLHFEGSKKQCKFKNFIEKYGAKEAVSTCRPKKYALHGFHGKVDDLIKLIERKENEYDIRHIFRIKEALIQKKIPLKEYVVHRNLEIDWSEYEEIVQNIGRMEKGNSGTESGISAIQEKFWICR